MNTRRLRFLASLLLLVTTATTLVVAQAPAPATFNPRDTIPFDTAVRTAALPNGLKYFVRKNDRPANRISIRLAVKAGSLYEADDQQGLAHLVEHMAFNGSAHFKPSELVAYFESVGARLGPHVNAYTSFDETVYMLDLPSDKPDVVAKGLTALADFAGGLSLFQEEVDKERGVVIEEWRLGLGAGARVRDKQLPVLFYQSRYAQRLPIGKPEVIRTAPVARLRAFYDTWYRPDRMAVIAVGDVDAAGLAGQIASTFSPLTARAPMAPLPDHTVPLHKDALISVVSDPELTRSSVSLVRERKREGEQLVSDYRRDLVTRLIDHMMDERFGELGRKPDAKFLGAGVGNSSLSRDVSTFTMSAGVQDGKLEDGIGVLTTEAQRVREFGFSGSELDRAKKWMAAFYDRAYQERTKTESGSFAQEYLSYFLIDEPSPGIEYEYRLVQQLIPSISEAEVSAMAKSLLGDDSRVILAVSPQKPGIKIPTEADLQAAISAAAAVRVTPWADTTVTRALLEHLPAPAGIASRRAIDSLGITIVTFANGVEAWLKPTDFKNDQVLFGMNALGGASLASCADEANATLAPAYTDFSGAGGLKATDLQKVLTGKLVSARPFISSSTHGVSGSAAPAQLETALQLLYQELTAPGDDPEAFALMKKQLEAMVANRGRSPGQVFAEKLAQINTSNHCTSQPLTPERIAGLDRAKMLAFYRDRFSNAADFKFFMVGAFKVDEAVPLLARYLGTLSSKGEAISKFTDIGVRFPEGTQRVKVEQGQDPKAQTVMSFYADPPPDPVEQENINAATTVLDIVLRDVLREDLGQTYTVGVNLSQQLPQRGGGHIQVRFGAAPENIDSMTTRVLQEIKKLQETAPSEDLTNRAKESARRTYETSLKQNDYWLRRLQSITMLGGDPSEIVTRGQRIDAVTPQALQDVFKKYFPETRSTIVTLVPAPPAKP
ncbi:MAG: insulinase family protein [Acidobacteria bacterium]|nr:insulinase family protein [Acidobacteriota bacterium]